MTYRFVHAADIHLDSPLRSLALRHSELAELIGNATRRAFVRVIDLCLDEQVDALLIAGDLYDGDQTSMKTARFLAEQLRRLDQAGIRVFIIRGNHDALSKITKELVLPDSVKIFGGRGEAIAIDRAPGRVPVVVHGLSFAQPHAPESLLGRYRPVVDGAVNIGLMHTSLGGAPGHDLYAPCSPADLQASGMKPAGLSRETDTELNKALENALRPIADAASDLGVPQRDADLLMVDVFAHAAGLLLLLHTGRIKMFNAAPEALMTVFAESKLREIGRRVST